MRFIVPLVWWVHLEIYNRVLCATISHLRLLGYPLSELDLYEDGTTKMFQLTSDQRIDFQLNAKELAQAYSIEIMLLMIFE